MALLSWLSQTNSDLANELGNGLSPKLSTDGGHIMMGMDVDVPEAENLSHEPVGVPLRRVDIAVDLPKVDPEKKKEFLLVEDLDGDDDGNEVSLVAYWL